MMLEVICCNGLILVFLVFCTCLLSVGFIAGEKNRFCDLFSVMCINLGIYIFFDLAVAI